VPDHAPSSWDHPQAGLISASAVPAETSRRPALSAPLEERLARQLSNPN